MFKYFDKEGRITIPIEIRNQLKIERNTPMFISKIGETIVIVKKENSEKDIKALITNLINERNK